MTMIVDVVAGACLVWYLFILTVCAIGFFQIQRNYSSRPRPPISPTLPLVQTPHITILRPVKGLEPHLYECLASSFQQAYPREKLTIYICISFRNDPAFPILERLLHDFPGFDAKILIEEEDPNLSGRNGHINNLGPNPKIRNMSRGYREAKGDVMWIIDCNVWTSPATAGNMVDLICGFTTPNPLTSQRTQKYKFVHQLPLVIDVLPPSSLSHRSSLKHLSGISGGQLEETFLSTSHAKFYTAISHVAVAPCVVGKSNMFRLSHLNALTSTKPLHSPGIDYFSDNICEDHLIGDLLWHSPVPPAVRAQAEKEGGLPGSSTAKWGNHALLPRSLAIQPVADMPLSSYLNRRIRWLRVRKFTVTLATLVEPGTESLLCSSYGAFGLTSLPLCNSRLQIPRTWPAFLLLWLVSVTGWMLADYLIWRRLQSGQTLDKDDAPAFARRRRKPWRQWVGAWLGREVLALPVWVWAVAGGVTVVWRGRRFWVGVDMKVHEIRGEGEGEVEKVNGDGDGHGVGRKAIVTQ